MLERISKKIGVTKTEIKILVFMLVVFISGFIYKSFIARTEEDVYKRQPVYISIIIIVYYLETSILFS